MLKVIALSASFGFFCCVGMRAQHEEPITVANGFLRVCGPKVPSADPVARAREEGGAPVDNTACNMYIFGIFEGIDSDADLLERFDGKNHRFICMPHGVVAADMRNVVVRFIQKDLQLYGDFRTNRIASLALADAYPCQAAKP